MNFEGPINNNLQGKCGTVLGPAFEQRGMTKGCAYACFREGWGNAEQPLVQEESNILGADLGQGLGNPVCTHTLKSHLAACRLQMRREMGQENFILLRSSTWTCLLQLVLQRGTFSGAAVKSPVFIHQEL